MLENYIYIVRNQEESGTVPQYDNEEELLILTIFLCVQKILLQSEQFPHEEGFNIYLPGLIVNKDFNKYLLKSSLTICSLISW